MQTQLASFIQGTAQGLEAEAILRTCVHCGFCTAVCPTYLLTGNELEGPRGRIYLIKEMLEGAVVTAKTQTHLDHCLTCRACETACPSGVRYGHLLDIGRAVLNERAPRPVSSRWIRRLLSAFLTSSALIPLYRVAQWLRVLFPLQVRHFVRPREHVPAWPQVRHVRHVLMPEGCVQRAMAPQINVATAQVLDALQFSVLRTPVSGCCGAIRQHLDDGEGARTQARHNIDVWWPAIVEGCSAIVSNASGCGLMLKDYGRLLQDDPLYATKAAKVSALVCDIAELVYAERASWLPRITSAQTQRIVFHAPCTLQHGQQRTGLVESLLTEAGVTLLPVSEGHLCCGSAGTYSLLQPRTAKALRERKLQGLTAAGPELILSANVGCISHLGAGTAIRVRHWVEWLAEALA